jgi:hypothetical protein
MSAPARRRVSGVPMCFGEAWMREVPFAEPDPLL